MEIKSQQIGNKLVVDLADVSDKAAVLSTIEGCASGECACSTDEYQKVQTMNIIPGENSIQLDIEVKPGEVIDPNCITECFEPISES